MFEAEGLKVLATERHPVTDEYRYTWALSNLAGLDDLIHDEKLDTGKVESIRKYSALLESEMRQGAMINTTFWCVVGRRAA